MEGVDGFYGCKVTDLDKARADGKTLTWREEGADVFCYTITAANFAFEASGRISVLAVEDTTGLRLVSDGLAVHSCVVHVCFPGHSNAHAVV